MEKFLFISENNYIDKYNKLNHTQKLCKPIFIGTKEKFTTCDNEIYMVLSEDTENFTKKINDNIYLIFEPKFGL